MSKSLEVTYKNNLLIVDGLNLAFRWKHSGAQDFHEEYLKTVQSFRRSYEAKHVVIAADSGKSSYRKRIYPEYKGDREEKFAVQSEAEKEIFLRFMADYNKALDYIKDHSDIQVIRFEKTEADDIAAYICCNYSQEFEYVWLLSTDEDWDLLLKDNISRFSYVSKKEFNLDNWHLHYDYPFEDHLSIKCLIGGEDNIKGVSGIGPKRAVSLVAEYGSIFDIIDAIPINSKYQFIKNLNNSKDNLLLNIELMDLVSFHTEALGDNTNHIDTLIRKLLDG